MLAVHSSCVYFQIICHTDTNCLLALLIMVSMWSIFFLFSLVNNKTCSTSWMIKIYFSVWQFIRVLFFWGCIVLIDIRRSRRLFLLSFNYFLVVLNEKVPILYNDVCVANACFLLILILLKRISIWLPV